MKKFFSTPKKAVISTICIAAVVLTAAVAVPTVIIGSTLIGKSEAEAAALKDAGLNASEISGCRTELDFEDGHFQYEVDFYSSGTEYEYIILAKDGDIISRDTDGGRYAEASPSDTVSEKTAGSESASNINTSEIQNPVISDEADAESIISLNKAKEAAIADAGLAESEVTFTKTRLDKDDRIQVYDIEFYTSEAEYDYEINASDGSVRERNTDTFRIYTDTDNSGITSNNDYIGVDKAKEIAVNHAGLTEAQVQFSKAKLENDDGETEYEVEFFFGNMEYEYSIDAVSGKILEFNSERS